MERLEEEETEVKHELVPGTSSNSECLSQAWGPAAIVAIWI